RHSRAKDTDALEVARRDLGRQRVRRRAHGRCARAAVAPRALAERTWRSDPDGAWRRLPVLQRAALGGAAGVVLLRVGDDTRTRATALRAARRQRGVAR